MQRDCAQAAGSRPDGAVQEDTGMNLSIAQGASDAYGVIAQALLNSFDTIYFVDLNTNHFREFSSAEDFKVLALPTEGKDFFSESRTNVLRVIHPEDQERMMKIFERDTILGLTDAGRKFRMEYRLIMNGEARHMRMKALRTDDGQHLIIALEDIESDVMRESQEDSSNQSIIFGHIAESLANQYGMIYYIDAETDQYFEFNASDEYKEFSITPEGSDFFAYSQRNVSLIAYPEDRERLFNALDKQNMLRQLEENGSFTMTYRLLLTNGSGYTRMSVFWANDKKHLIMAVQNIDNEIQREKTLKKMAEKNAVFSQIAESLANQYDTIYYVDVLTDHYLEFVSSDVYKDLDVRPVGDDFFADSIINIDSVIFPEDRDDVHRILTKASMLQMLQGKHMITHTYRLLIGGNVLYTRMSIIWATDNKHLIIGITNIDQEVRKEMELQKQLLAANEKAYRDELTGVKNKNAYGEYEAQLQAAIDNGTVKDFALLICDLNGLKTVNDRFGHIMGDAYIKSASNLICHIWDHSPVFRIGGDEFAVILQGTDYENRAALMQQMDEIIQENMKHDRVVFAAGLAEYVPGSTLSVADVFACADSRMYENKAALAAK